MKKPPFTAEELKSVLHYDPVIGEWTWTAKSHPKSHIKVGDKAGTVRKDGYRQIMVYGKLYLSSRLAWLYMTGGWPVLDIDHKDVNPSNDRWDNLREATKFQNSANQKLRKTNKSGFKGVNYHKASNKFIARARLSGEQIYVGVFDRAVDAYAAVSAEVSRHNGEFARVS